MIAWLASSFPRSPLVTMEPEPSPRESRAAEGGGRASAGHPRRGWEERPEEKPEPAVASPPLGGYPQKTVSVLEGTCGLESSVLRPGLFQALLNPTCPHPSVWSSLLLQSPSLQPPLPASVRVLSLSKQQQHWPQLPHHPSLLHSDLTRTQL